MGLESKDKLPCVAIRVLCAALFVALLAAHPAAAGPDIAAATAFAEKVENTSLKYVTDTSVPRAARAERVREVFERDFDLEAMARFVLGTYWHAASEEQRAEYMQLFEKALVRQYTLRLEDFEGMTLEPVKVTPAGTRDVIITREAHHTDGMVVGMEWRVREKDGAFRIVDLSVLGISMGLTLRGEFAEVIRRGGGNVEALLFSLRKRTKTMFAQNTR